MVDLTEEEFQLARAEISKNLADPYRAFTTETLITRYAAYLQSRLDALSAPSTSITPPVTQAASAEGESVASAYELKLAVNILKGADTIMNVYAVADVKALARALLRTAADPWCHDMSKAPEGKAVELWVPEKKCIYMAVHRKKEGWSIFGGDWREHIQRGTAWREPSAPPTEAGHE